MISIWRCYLLVALLSILSFGLFASEGEESALLWAFKNGREGFIDANGKVAFGFEEAPCMYSDFSQNRAIKYTKEACFVIDQHGNTVKELKVDFAWMFEEGLAWVRDGLKWGAIDLQGNMVIPVKFSMVKQFSEGLAPVSDSSPGRRHPFWGFCNKSGEVIIPCKYKQVRRFQNGLAAVLDGTKWSYIDIQGNVFAETVFRSRASNFSGGHAIAGDMYYKGKVIAEDSIPAGTSVGLPDYVYRQTLLRRTEGGVISIPLSGVSNIENSGITKFEIEGIYPISHDLAACHIFIGGGEGYAYMDLKSQKLVAGFYEQIWPYSEGVAVVGATWERNQYGHWKTATPDTKAYNDTMLNIRWAGVSVSGEVVIEPLFDDLLPSRRQVFAACNYEFESDLYRSGYIDRQGKYIWMTESKGFRIAPDWFIERNRIMAEYYTRYTDNSVSYWEQMLTGKVITTHNQPELY